MLTFLFRNVRTMHLGGIGGMEDNGMEEGKGRWVQDNPIDKTKKKRRASNKRGGGITTDSFATLVLTPASVSFFTSAFMSVSLSVYKRSGSIIAAHPSGCAVHALIWQHIQWVCCILSASVIEVPKPEARRLRSLVTHPVSSFSRGALMNMYTGNGHKTMKSVLHAAYMRVNKTSVFQIASSVPHSVEAFVGGIALISSSALIRSILFSPLVN
mmetsp:Transcript_8397/g.20656  ORF Transcript_8397/g.20656 Transcript_8397/m.20656 type:complete len:213 (+) Transcript_8397:149-787(+)